jgi:hypothetical protein
LVKVLLHRTQRTGGDVSSDHILPLQRLHPLTSEGNLYHPLCVCVALGVSAASPSQAWSCCCVSGIHWSGAGPPGPAGHLPRTAGLQPQGTHSVGLLEWQLFNECCMNVAEGGC